RSGASIAAAWMVYNYLGFSGYKKGVSKVMNLTKWFVDQIESIPELDIIVKPELNIVGICSSGDVDIKSILSDIREKGWAVSEWSNYIRIVIMPHVTKGSLKKFLKDLKMIVKNN
ncbi:MAG: hypothetical protein B6229_08030, partial [Spirochaetaceae bacterium 4572_7]